MDIGFRTKEEHVKAISKHEHEIEIENIRWNAIQEGRELSDEEKYKINLLEHRIMILRYEIKIGVARSMIAYLEDKVEKDESK